MRLNEIRDDVWEVIEMKGFHGTPHTHKETITFRQITHLTTEWGEAYDAHLRWFHSSFQPMADQLFRHMCEELADIAIIALDLAAVHDLDLRVIDKWHDPMDRSGTQDRFISVIMSIAMLGDDYRKQRDVCRLREILVRTFNLMQFLGVDPMAEIAAKMQINEQRPTRYGLAVEASA